MVPIQASRVIQFRAKHSRENTGREEANPSGHPTNPLRDPTNPSAGWREAPISPRGFAAAPAPCSGLPQTHRDLCQHNTWTGKTAGEHDVLLIQTVGQPEVQSGVKSRGKYY